MKSNKSYFGKIKLNKIEGKGKLFENHINFCNNFKSTKKVIPLVHGLTCAEFFNGQSSDKDWEIFADTLKHTVIELDK